MIHVIEAPAPPETNCRCGADPSYLAPRLKRPMCSACAARVADFTPLVPIEAIRGRTPDS